MNATLIVRTTGNQTSITIQRSMSFKIMQIATTDKANTLRSLIVNLSNAGYAVKVDEQ